MAVEKDISGTRFPGWQVNHVLGLKERFGEPLPDGFDPDPLLPLLDEKVEKYTVPSAWGRIVRISSAPEW